MKRSIAVFVTLLMLLAAHSPAVGQTICTCPKDGGCYHFLNAPVEPPNDPCPCPGCEAQRGSCEKVLPDGWDPTCFGNRKMECFLRRHAASWKIACSERLAGACECRNPHPDRCPRCGKNGEAWGEDQFEMLRRQIEVERKLLGPRTPFVLAQSEHFYLVTDIRKLRIVTQERMKRFMGMHEVAHVFLQRAEVARREFISVFGDRVTSPRPTAIYLFEKERTKQAFAQEYIGHLEPELAYGGDYKRIAGGHAYNVLAISKEKYDEDDWLHLQMRHLIGHLLISCWVRVDGRNEYLPRWVYSGAGHWLSRTPEKFREMANFCAGEGVEVKHSGENWQKRLVRYAVDPKSHPIQAIFDVNALGGLDLEMHMRAWSWFDLFLEEDREPFVQFLAALRDAKDPRASLMEAFGCSAEELDERWKERVLGRRQSLAPTPEELDAANPESPGARARAGIRGETDPAGLAARIRALGAITDPLTAATILPHLAGESDRVRETIVVVLSRTKSPAVLGLLREEGLAGQSGVVKAQVARIVGNIGDTDSAGALVHATKDPYWLVRAHAARALGLLRHEPSLRRLVEISEDRSGKVRLAALDALARFGARAAFATGDVADRLSDSAWQVRSAAADCLGEFGSMEAVEPLIERMKAEGGRVRRDIRRALAKITRDDLGNDPEEWDRWFRKEAERAGGVPPRPGEAPPPPEGEHDYGVPTYYGIRLFSRGVGYVMDTSASMSYEIELDPDWVKKSRRDYPAKATKFDLARGEIEASLAALDPRTRINLYFLRTHPLAWRSSMVPASPKNVEAAVTRLAGERPRDSFGQQAYRTNYVDTFRLVLETKEGGSPSPNFADTPDTVLFLTDGKPTVGDITEPDVLLSWLAEKNRFARIRLHVITFGSLETDDRFLRKLAEGHGGKFVRVPSAR